MLVKICGVKTPEVITAAVEAGARYLGFVFFPKSPRCIDFDLAERLAAGAPPGVMKVALVVDPDDELLDRLAAAPLDMAQLHGGESPERVREVKARTGLPAMKAVGVADAADLAKIDLYEDVADQLLIDAKPPKDGVLPGGNGLAFDWRLIANRQWRKPWMLAGGLTAENVAEAVGLTGAKQVDDSSGEGTAPGIKSPELIREFVSAAG